MHKSPIIIIGAGPSGLMAAQYLAEQGYTVHIYEQQKAAARKFLVAGHGGFNLTHSEPTDEFVHRYDNDILHDIIHNFDNKRTVSWLQDLGIETYIGSSGKIFPIKGIKPIQVLQAWLSRLASLGVIIHYEHRMTDFNNQHVTISHHDELQHLVYDRLIIALGGGSWAKTGSDAQWVPLLTAKDIKIAPLQSANSGYNTQENFKDLEGQNLKNIAVKYGDVYKKGELVFTSYGLEGSAIYYLNRYTRTTAFPYFISIDLKPNLEEQYIQEILENTTNTTKALKEKVKLNTTALALLKKLPKDTYIDAKALAAAIKKYPIEVTSLRPIDEVISTAGGITFDELDVALSLKKYPKVYCLGEMLDWEAPTGGYLLQACFSMGIWAAQDITRSKSLE